MHREVKNYNNFYLNLNKVNLNSPKIINRNIQKNLKDFLFDKNSIIFK